MDLSPQLCVAESSTKINTIRAWLGHVSLQTTNRYAEVDLERKAKALDTCAVTNSERTPAWRNKDLMTFLSSL